MPNRLIHVTTVISMAVSAGCSRPHPKPLVEPLTIRVTAADSTRPARFTMDVTGGQAEFSTPELRGKAGEPSLTASTPAELVLSPGTTSASFRGLDGAKLEVVAATSRARLIADGSRVRVASTDVGLSIRDF